MRTFYLLLVSFLVSSQFATAQYYVLDIGDHEQRPCETDSTTLIDTYSNLRIYSTLDDTWDGPIDSSLCYSLTFNGNFGLLPNGSVPTGRSAFFEIVFDDSLSIDTSMVYVIREMLYFSGSGNASQNVYVSLLMPDSAGIQTVAKVVSLTFDTEHWATEVCFASQVIPDQRITRIIYQYVSQGENMFIQFYSAEIHPPDLGTIIVPKIVEIPYLEIGPNIIRYWHEIYPTVDSISYTDIYPWGNPTDSVLVQLVVEPSTTIHYQEYTALRGGLVQGSDSARHGLEVILQGSMCVAWMDVMWHSGTSLTIDGGSVHMHSSKSCNQFGRGSALKVKSGTRFEYGHFGVGMLALRTGAQLIIEPDAELVINGPVFMYEFQNDNSPQQLYMELPAGAKLTFAEGSSISNQYSFDGTMKLNIHMVGGEVDLTGLNAEEQQLINLIYDKPSPRSWENLTVYPNPTEDDIQLLWVAEDANEHLNYEVVNMSGITVLSGALRTSNPGHNRLVLETTELISGMYIIRLSSEKGVLARRRFSKV